MRSFRSACSDGFSSYSKEMGESLAHDGEVTLAPRGPPSFVARVDGESVAIVMARGSPKMSSSCTCKLFALGLDGCRHLWALVAALEDAGAMTSALLRPGFALVPRRPTKKLAIAARDSWPGTGASPSEQGLLTRSRRALRRRARGRARPRPREPAGAGRVLRRQVLAKEGAARPSRRRVVA